MTLINEVWHVWDGEKLVPATQSQIDEHFSRKPADNGWWNNDYS